MRLREHVTDLLTGPDIPVRYILRFHRLFPLRFQSFTFTHTLHDRKGKCTFHSLVDQIDHDIVTGTDCRRNGCFSGFYKFLCISKPYIRSMGQTGNSDQIGQCLWLCVLHHLDNEVRTELRDSKTSKLTPINVFRFDSKDFRTMK